MASVNDKQTDLSLFHGGTAYQQIHSPAGQTPAHGADNPIVANSVVAFSAGKQITTPLKVVLPNGTRIANPA